jgi:hypothetical protein
LVSDIRPRLPEKPVRRILGPRIAEMLNKELINVHIAKYN